MPRNKSLLLGVALTLPIAIFICRGRNIAFPTVATPDAGRMVRSLPPGHSQLARKLHRRSDRNLS